MKKAVPRQQEDRVEEASVGLVSFGTAKSPIQAARAELKTEGHETSFLNLSWLWPFPYEQVNDFLAAHETIVVIENNRSGQLARLITQETGNNKLLKINKYDGRPFWPNELSDQITKLVFENGAD
jgi:2-oxoglutarate ferredoxin oxidoreductase subunit alpha